jgi:predicted phage-related endonuclease
VIIMPDPTRQTISATQAPALFGVSPYITRWMLYRHFAHGDKIDSPEHNRMNWGKQLQPLLLAAAAEDLHLEVIPNANDVYVRQGLFGCTRDATIICPSRGPGALETKCCFDYGVWMRDWGGGKAPPKHVEIQTQVQMIVGDGKTSFDWGVIAVWVCGEMHYFERKIIPELWEQLGNAALRFFSDVYGGHEPDPFGAAVEMPLLAKVFATDPGKVVSFTEGPEAETLAEEVRMMAWHAAERLSHEKGEKALKAKVLGLLKDASEGQFLHGIKVTVTQSARNGHVVGPHTVTTIKPFVPQQVPT